MRVLEVRVQVLVDGIAQGAVLSLVHHRAADETRIRAWVGRGVIPRTIVPGVAESPVLQLGARLLGAVELKQDSC